MSHSNLFATLILFIFLTNSAWAQEQSVLILETEIFYFGSGQSRLAPKYKPQLDNIVKALNNNPKATAWIAAHTDSIGNYELNDKLAQKRAQVIKDALLKKNADVTRVKVNSYGEMAPYMTNATAEGRAKNRRVTVDVLEPYTPKVKEEKTIPDFYISGKVYDYKSKDIISNATLIVSGMGYSDTVQTNTSGIYAIELPNPMMVTVKATAPNYFFKTQQTGVAAREPQTLDFGLKATIKGEKMELGGLYFKGGSPVLLGTSVDALNNILAFLKENKDLKVEVGGHINKPNIPPVQENTPSFQLSLNRAKSVYNYLTSMGISEDRITYKGYGNWNMVYPKASNPAEEQANRRVELKVLE